MNSLDQALNNNKNILGHNYKNLGQRVGFRKIMLSFDNNNGWRVRNLSIFQLFLKKGFGRYKSTHLLHIAQSFNAVSGLSVHPLNDRMHIIWKEKYPNKDFPKYWSAFGNTTLSHAQVFCLTEFHTQLLHRQANGHFINTHFRPGDVILVEAIPCTKTISSLESLQLAFVNPKQEVQGWEPADFNNFHLKIAGCYGVLLKKLDDAAVKIINPDPKESDLKEFLKCYKESAKKANYSKVPILNLIQRQYHLRKRIKLLQNSIKTAQISKNYDSFYDLIVQEVKIMMKKLQETAYKNISKETCELIFSQMNARNESLIKEVRKHINQNRRVFIVTGASHILKIDSRALAPTPEKVQRAFKNYNHLIFMDDSLVQKRKIVKLNPEIEYLAHKF